MVLLMSRLNLSTRTVSAYPHSHNAKRRNSLNTKVVIAALAVVAGGMVFADETNDVASVVETGSATNAVASAADRGRARRLALRKKVGERARKDFEKYGKEGLREIERLYRAYSQSKEVEPEELKTLLEKYSDANRTGCAVMYAGQRAGKEGEKWFRLAIEKSSDCYYGDGVCVGAYARWYLAGLYKELGKTEEAEKLISEIKALYPDAVNHRGRPLAVSLGR